MEKLVIICGLWAMSRFCDNSLIDYTRARAEFPPTI
jgi:hypothetical protein